MLILRESIRFMIPIRCLHHGKWILFYAPHIFPSSILTRNWNCTGLARILDAANTFSSRRHPHGYAIAALPVATVSHKTATGKRKEKKKGNKKILWSKFLLRPGDFHSSSFFTPYGAGSSATIIAGGGAKSYTTGLCSGSASAPAAISGFPSTASIHSARAIFSFSGFPE